MPESDSSREICDVRIAGKKIMSNRFADHQRFKKREMGNSVKDRLASQALELLIDFEMALSERKRKYPVQEFFAFASAARRVHRPDPSGSVGAQGRGGGPKRFARMSRGEEKRGARRGLARGRPIGKPLLRRLRSIFRR